MGDALLWCGVRLPIAKSGSCTKRKAKSVRPTITVITQSQLERGLWIKDYTQLYTREDIQQHE